VRLPGPQQLSVLARLRASGTTHFTLDVNGSFEPGLSVPCGGMRRGGVRKGWRASGGAGWAYP
jgi:hypothetical protein